MLVNGLRSFALHSIDHAALQFASGVVNYILSSTIFLFGSIAHGRAKSNPMYSNLNIASARLSCRNTIWHGPHPISREFHHKAHFPLQRTAGLPVLSPKHCGSFTLMGRLSAESKEPNPLARHHSLGLAHRRRHRVLQTVLCSPDPPSPRPGPSSYRRLRSRSSTILPGPVQHT